MKLGKVTNKNKKDIRCISFQRYKLDDQSFSGAISGLKLIQKILLSSFSIIGFSLTSVVPILSGGILESIVLFTKDYSSPFVLISSIIYLASLLTIVLRGFQLASIAFIIGLLVFGVASYVVLDQEAFIPLIFIALSIFSAWISTILGAFFMILNSSFLGVLGNFLALVGYTSFTALSIPLAIKGPFEKLPGGGTITTVSAIAVILTGAIIARQAVRGSPKFAWIKEKAVFWAATGGTSFYGVDLTDACFDGADLPHTDFRKAILTRASFKDATGLELARLQGTILEQPKVRKLLVNQKGIDEDYTGANFNGASLRGANLTGAILAEVQALDADFTGATLTDACIQGWNINTNTRFKDVKCKRIYLKCSRDGNKIKCWEPKPDSGEFKPGEFEKWIGEIQNTVDLIFREGLNWKAFIFSLAQTAIEHEGLDLSRYSITRKDENTVFAKIGVFPGADNAAIHQSFQSNYEYADKAIEAKYQLVLQAKDSEIERLKTFAESNQQILRELMSIAAGTGRQVLIQGEAHRIYLLNQAEGEVEIMDSKQETNVSGDLVGGNKGNNASIGSIGGNMNLTGSSLAGDLNHVTNTIQQLRDINTDKVDELANILTALKESVAHDQVLLESQKKEALEAVETIAEEGKKLPEERALKYCSMAVNALKGITSTVTDVSKLAEVFNTHLPTLTGLLGI